MKAVITVGVSASGKTTWAESQNAMVVSRDNVRRTILEQRLHRKLSPGELWTRWKFGKDESSVTEVCWASICSCARLGQDVIIADTNLNRDRNNQLKAKLEKLGFEVEFKEFPITLEEAWKRDAGRADGVGHAVLAKQYDQWLEYIGQRKYVADISKPRAIMVDIDGTLAHMNGKRGAFDWEKVYLDDLDAAVYHAVRGFYMQGFEILITSGRDAVCYDLTEKWMVDNNVPFTKLFMRSAGDMRKDSIIKEELFFNHIADNWNVFAVFDDRPQVVRKWTQLGIKVFAIGNQYLEF